MYYIANGKTINLDCEYTHEFFCELKEKLSFAYDVLYVKRKKRVIKDFILENKFSDEKFIQAILAQDYDLSGYLFLQLSGILSITDLQDVLCGEKTDKYSVDDELHDGDQYTFAELAYENNWSILSFQNITIQNMIKKISKNSSNPRKICTICNEKQFLLCNCLKSDAFLGEYVSSFDDVFCSLNYSFEDWDSLDFEHRFKILAMFYTEITYILNNEFQKLSRYPGRNKNRVEKIDEGLFEYRIDNPNYRLYYIRDKEKLVALMGRLKKENRISKKVKAKLNNLRKNPYIKVINEK